MGETQFYRSYLLRIWQSGEGVTGRLTVALEDVRTGERRGFINLAEALSHLEAQLPIGLTHTPDHNDGPRPPG